MLTEKQITELQKPFTLAEHGFYQKSPYILKSAIRARLNRITPGWLLLPPELIALPHVGWDVSTRFHFE